MPHEIDIDRARRETPGCENVLHFNNAGAALMPQKVVDSVISHLRLESRVGGYEAADQASAVIDHVYDSAAALQNCHRDEVAIIENATRAWDMAFYAIPFRRGDRVLTAKAAYASNYIAFLQMAQQKGIKIDVIPDDENGQVSIDALRQMIDSDVRLIALTHVPTNGGLVNPAEAVGKVARENGILYLLDACQSVGQMPIDVKRIGCDMLSATGRKFLRGPRGTGLLYVRRSALDLLEPPFLDLHAATWISAGRYEVRADARRFENWETNVAAKIGLGAAIDYALKWHLEPIWRRIRNLSASLRDMLVKVPGATVHDKGQVQCGIVTFTLDGIPSERVAADLRKQGMNVDTSTVFSTRLDMEERNLGELVRASVHYYNSDEEVVNFVGALEKMSVH